MGKIMEHHNVSGTFDSFITLYSPKKNPINDFAPYDGLMFETYGEEGKYIDSYDENFVWTLVEDDGEIFIVPGKRLVNRIGFFVTKNPWAHKDLIFKDE